jgi:hypothetical protein
MSRNTPTSPKISRLHLEQHEYTWGGGGGEGFGGFETNPQNLIKSQFDFGISEVSTSLPYSVALYRNTITGTARNSVPTPNG